MATDLRHRGADIRTFQRVADRISELRYYARDQHAVTVDIDRAARTRLVLYRQLAETGPSELTRETIQDLDRRLDFLYEELRISRMVAA